MTFPQSSSELELAEKVLVAAIAALAAHGEPDPMIAERTNIVRCAGIEAEDGSYEVRTFLDSEGMLDVFYTVFDIERLAAHRYLHSSECEEEHYILRAHQGRILKFESHSVKGIVLPELEAIARGETTQQRRDEAW